MKTREVFLDAEANSLWPTKMWCATLIDKKTKEVFEFGPDRLQELKSFLESEVKKIIGHNIINYDEMKLLRPILNVNMEGIEVEDTLVKSRLFYPDRSDKWAREWRKKNGMNSNIPPIFFKKPHAIESWGTWFKRYKPEHEDWSKFTPEMQHRCTEDTWINFYLDKYLDKEAPAFSPESIKLEHEVARIVTEQQQHGMYLYQDRAHDLFLETKGIWLDLRKKISEKFPPKPKNIGHYTYRTKTLKINTGLKEKNPDTGRMRVVYKEEYELSSIGLQWWTSWRQDVEPDPQDNIDRGWKCPEYLKKYDNLSDLEFCKEVIGGDATKIEWIYFNPTSAQQAVERLDESGWTPVIFNKPTPAMKKEGRTQGSPKITDEDNLATIPDDAPQEIKDIGTLWMCQQRWKLAEAWLECVHDDGYVRGGVNTMGTPTARFRHFDPNMANVPSVIVKEKEDEVTKKVKKIILKGLEGRYGWDCRDCLGVPPNTNRRLVGIDASGLELRMLAHYMNDNEYTYEVVNGDVHTKNQIAAGLPSRSVAKTFIYGFLYGAGAAKIGLIVNGTARDGMMLKEKFLAATPALKKLIEEVQQQADQGWLEGLDGRRIYVRSQHAALNSLLQSAGAIVMKKALVILDKWIKRFDLDAHFVNNVHDEWQLDCDMYDAPHVLELGKKAIKEAGKQLKLNCPLDGDGAIGYTWAETH